MSIIDRFWHLQHFIKTGIFLFFILSMTKYVSSNEDTSNALLTAIVWSPDSQWIAAATTDGIYIHDAQTLHILQHINEGEAVSAVDWSPDGRQIAIDTPNEYIRIIDLSSNISLDLIQHKSDVSDVRWSPNGQFLASKSMDEIYVLNMTTNKILFSRSGYFHTPTLAWSPDSQMIATHQDEYFVVWNIYTEVKVSYWYDDIESSLIAWSPKGEFIVVGGLTGVLRIFPLENKQQIGKLKVDDYSVESLSWRANGEIIATRGWVDASSTTQAVIRIWNIVDRSMLAEIPGGYIAGGINYRGIEWSPDGSMLAVASDDGTISVYDADTLDLKVKYEGYISVIASLK